MIVYQTPKSFGYPPEKKNSMWKFIRLIRALGLPLNDVLMYNSHYMVEFPLAKFLFLNKISQKEKYFLPPLKSTN